MSSEKSVSLVIDGDRIDRDYFAQELSRDERLDVYYRVYETIEALPLILSIYGATLATIKFVMDLYEKRKKTNPSLHVTIKLPYGESFDLENFRIENIEGKIPTDSKSLRLYELIALQSGRTNNGIILKEEELMQSARTLTGRTILCQGMALDPYFNRIRYSEFEDGKICVKILVGNEKINQLIADGKIKGSCVKGSCRSMENFTPIGIVLDSLILVDDSSSIKTDCCVPGELRTVIHGPLMLPPKLIKEF